MKNNKKKILILTSSGGGGHLQAALAKHLELSANHNFDITQKDIFLDFLGNYIGKSFVTAWNYCQTHGKITSLYIFSISSRIVDTLFSPILTIKFLYQLHKYNIDTVIDTQPIGTKIFIRSIRLYSKIKKKEIHYEKIMTDLPTSKCHHFFKPILKLNNTDKKYFHLVTTKPYIKNNKKDSTFWKKETGLSKENISYRNFPLRPEFINHTHKKKPLSLTFNTYNPENTHIITKCISYGNTTFIRKKNSITINISDERLSLITLGSFPQKSVLISYIKKFIQQKIDHKTKKNDLLFILVGPQKTSQSFYESIVKIIETENYYPSKLTIIPLAFQNAYVLAPLYFNLDLIIAKAGGLTSMEILQAVKGHIFIHSNQLPKFSKYLTYLTKNKFDCMPAWERGNAEYLIERKKAQIIKPELFIEKTNIFFSEPRKYNLQSI